MASAVIYGVNSSGEYVALSPGAAVLPGQHVRYSAEGFNAVAVLKPVEFSLNGSVFASPRLDVNGNAYYDTVAPTTEGTYTFEASVQIPLLFIHQTASTTFVVSNNAPPIPNPPPGGGIGGTLHTLEIAGIGIGALAALSLVAGIVRTAEGR